MFWIYINGLPKLVTIREERLLLYFVGQETYSSPSHPAVKLGHIVICVRQGTAEKQPLADAVLPGKMTFQKKRVVEQHSCYILLCLPLRYGHKAMMKVIRLLT